MLGICPRLPVWAGKNNERFKKTTRQRLSSSARQFVNLRCSSIPFPAEVYSKNFKTSPVTKTHFRQLARMIKLFREIKTNI